MRAARAAADEPAMTVHWPPSSPVLIVIDPTRGRRRVYLLDARSRLRAGITIATLAALCAGGEPAPPATSTQDGRIRHGPEVLTLRGRIELLPSGRLTLTTAEGSLYPLTGPAASTLAELLSATSLRLAEDVAVTGTHAESAALANGIAARTFVVSSLAARTPQPIVSATG